MLRSLCSLGVLLLACTGCQMAPEKSAAKMLVMEAVAAIEEQGAAVFPDFRTEGSRWFQGDNYVFVSEMSGTVLVQPSNAAMEGQNHIDLKDSDGKMMVREMIDVVAKSGSGWVDYRWPRPGETEPSDKSTFVMKTSLGERDIVVGSGVYRAEK